ncbi:MAG: C39 family peptidase [Spirochaetales bacterium]|nr:C39 family peptidase [Spirochaetales bacterium]
MKLPITMLSQPDDTTCGPTSLHAVLNYYGYSMPLDQVIRETGTLKDGGTLAVFLGIHALKIGLSACLYNYNLRVFDPSWNGLDAQALIGKLAAQIPYKTSKKLVLSIKAYIEFLELGGVIRFDDLSPRIIREPLLRGVPVLTGLSATYLYSSKREYTNSQNKSVYDDLRGEPMGHFVVLGGITHSEVFVFDPYKDNPLSRSKSYHVKIQKLINSILLGSLTYDENLLVLEKKSSSAR